MFTLFELISVLNSFNECSTALYPPLRLIHEVRKIGAKIGNSVRHLIQWNEWIMSGTAFLKKSSLHPILTKQGSFEPMVTSPLGEDLL